MSDTLTRTAPAGPAEASGPDDVLCRRCLTPGRGWGWCGHVRCEPCHRAVHGDHATDLLILSDFGRFGEWWTYALFTRADSYPTVNHPAVQEEDPHDDD